MYSFKSKVIGKYQVLGGFFSWLCPYCNQSIMSTHDKKIHADWKDATMINKANITESGKHDGYGHIGYFDAFVFAALPDTEYYDKVKKEGEEDADYWLDSVSEDIRFKAIDNDTPIKIYHSYCYKQAGSPKYAQAKESKSCPHQGIPTGNIKEIAKKPLADFLKK